MFTFVSVAIVEIRKSLKKNKTKKKKKKKNTCVAVKGAPVLCNGLSLTLYVIRIFSLAPLNDRKAKASLNQLCVDPLKDYYWS